FFFFRAEDGIRDFHVTGVQTCALPILGYDRPLPVQLWEWLAGALRGDLGVSLRYDRPVTELIMGRLDVTLALTIGATMLAVLTRSEEHTSELQSRENLVCRLLLEKKNY